MGALPPTGVLARCGGCGSLLPAEDGPTHRYLESSPACWRRYGEVLAREYGDRAYWAVHQLTVDAYAVQHPGRVSPQTIRSAAIHLVRLYLQLERGVDGERLLEATRAVVQRKNSLPWLTPPGSMGEVTVIDVYAARSAGEHLERVRAWARSAWSAWTEHHDRIRSWTPTVP